jgi:hypothetical protein
VMVRGYVVRADVVRVKVRAGVSNRVFWMIF